MRERSCDVAVIGAGSAGCVAAAELVAAGHRVALVEAGPDYGPFSRRWPRALTDADRRSERHDWGYWAEAGPGRLSPEPRARVVGGCSAHNESAVVWPPAEDLDAWAIPGWTARELWPLVDRIEGATGGSIIRGRNGPLPTAPEGGRLGSWPAAFAAGATACGFPWLIEADAPGPATGVAPFFTNIKDRVRWNAAFAFLDPVRERPELAILPRTTAVALDLAGGRALTLRCRDPRGELRLRAARYLLTAGVYGSPALLARSRYRAAALGQGLQEHPGVALGYRVRRTAAGRALEAGLAGAGRVVLRASSGTTPHPWDLHLIPSPTADDGGLAILVFLLAPRSRGVVDLNAGEPRIRFRFFAGPGRRDLDGLAAGVRIGRAIGDRLGLAVVESSPGRGAPSDALRRWIRTAVTGYAHPVGTCRMGTASDSVVDRRGRVRGLANVQVADASIVPRIPRANTNALAMLIGLRVAGFVAEAFAT